MSEFLTFIHLGFRHLVATEALDHILFLLALAVIYRPRDWREGFWVVTAFTIGHSITLALAVTGVITFPVRMIEFLIPVTILATSAENLIAYAQGSPPGRRRYRVVFAGIFGLVHGAGFAAYLRSLFLDRIAVPLFGFNAGIELGQVLVLLCAGATFTAFDSLVSRTREHQSEWALHVRVVAVSAVVALFAAHLAFERTPW